MNPAIIETPIRSFADKGIQAAVNKALAQLPVGTHGAVVAYADKDGASLATMARYGSHWSVVMVGERKWSGKLSGEAAVTFTW